MGRELAAIYRRVWQSVRAMPLLAALPLAVQLLQRGLPALDLVPSAQARYFAIGVTILNTLAMLVVTVFALRWWRFDGDRARVRRIGGRVLWGVVAMMAIQLTDEYLFTSAGHLVADLAGRGHALFVAGAQLLWLLVSVPLFPWYVAMLGDDRGLTLRQAIVAVRPLWLRGFALVLGAVLPLLVIGIALRMAIGTMPYGSVGSRLFEGAFMLLVPALILTTASAYFAIYHLARPGNLSGG